MHILPAGGLIVNTPGMRELQLWDVDDGLNQYFEDIEILAKNCRFNDCKHDTEPGCTVKDSISKGLLDKSRLENWDKIKR